MNGHLRTSWTLWVVKEHVIYGGTYCITDCLLITVYAYDHTIKASANRGKSIKYFKTGLGVGKNLKRLETLIKENNHTNTVIEYLKVLRNLLVQNLIENSLFKIDIEWAEFQTGGFSDWFSSGVLQNVTQLGMILLMLSSVFRN